MGQVQALAAISNTKSDLSPRELCINTHVYCLNRHAGINDPHC